MGGQTTGALGALNATMKEGDSEENDNAAQMTPQLFRAEMERLKAEQDADESRAEKELCLLERRFAHLESQVKVLMSLL